MPKYYFHTADGSRERDTTGTELAGPAAARIHAIRYAGECMNDRPDVLWDTRDFRVEVTNHYDDLLFTIITIAINAPAADGIA